MDSRSRRTCGYSARQASPNLQQPQSMGCAQYCAAGCHWPAGCAVDVALICNAHLHPLDPGSDGRPVDRDTLVFLMVCHLAGRAGRRRSTRQAKPYRMCLAGLHTGFFRLGLPDVPVFVGLPTFWHLDGPGLSHYHYPATAGVSNHLSLVAAHTTRYASFCP